MERDRRVETTSEQETMEAGREFAAGLHEGDVVLLSGVLGAGKTAFVRGLAEGLGAAPSDVSSPTFTILQEYRGRITLQHADLYRLTAVEAEDLGLDDLIDRAVLAVEWPDRWASAPLDAIAVTIESLGGDRRVIRYSTR
ncbi:MAG TPA: tRNA (adenosine(37)-N6)-threonylcarbamoyltransferase complex ATPase subunit type 1 TsaE [Vicinamibacterales bacterium]|nr:tRNA (adenosine(37)-N6)-threonylcarbamoyltransferase complex ATPase subunit type 1 TsaE [Vicinamibacterales bacterium]